MRAIAAIFTTLALTLPTLAASGTGGGKVSPTKPPSGAEAEWTISQTGGSEIEIPVFMTRGYVRALMDNGEDYGTAFEPELYPVQLRQYRTRATGRPFAYLEGSLGSFADEVTYTVDRPGLGVISGYTNGNTEIFYGMCRKDGAIICFDIRWPKEMQPMMGPIAERIALGFRDGI